MASIPLPQFPPEFKPRCFKCSSLTLHFNFTRHPYIWNQTEIQFSCTMCGTAGFGEDAVIAKFTPQLEEWQRTQGQRARNDEADRQAREATDAARQAAQQAAESIRLAKVREEEREREQSAEKSAVADRRRAEKAERKRIRDRERRARIRALSQAVREATAALVAANSTSTQIVLESSPPTPTVDKEALRRATLERRRRLDRERRARARAAAAIARREAAVPPPQSKEREQVTLCSWHECESPSAVGSKYCSRNCSVKNSRQNARLRKASKDVA